jgi:multiple sugar transport system ATP-binding protein
MASVTLKNISKTYISKKEKVKAVRDLNLEIRDGEFLCLLGPSGCGKTTTMRMIVGLEDITDGEIYIDDRLVNGLTPQQRNVAMSFETYALYTHLTVRENIAFPLKANKVPKHEIAPRLDRVVKMLELEDMLDRSPSQLSGGQQQRVSLARALIREPAVFLLDEPLSHLDVRLRTSTRAQIKHIHDELKTTFIYVTHDQLEAVSLADRIAVMNFALLQQVGTREELLSYPVNKFVADFIGEPAINLFECLLAKKDGKLYLSSKSGGFEIPVPALFVDAVKETGKDNFTVGIRPHDLQLREEEGFTKISGVVDVFEFLGEESHLTLTIGGEWLTVVVSANEEFEVGEKVDLYVREDRIHLFDVDTEECISTKVKLQQQQK